VKDRVDAVERAAEDFGVAYVADDELDLVVQVLGPLRVAVYLLHEAVEGAYRVAGGEELVGQVRADEPGAAGDEHALGHGRERYAFSPGGFSGRSRRTGCRRPG
jgi:hypothetical protein